MPNVPPKVPNGRVGEGQHQVGRTRIAAMRRHLPSGAVVPDYEFQEGPANLDAGDAPITTVRLSDLFTGPNRSVVISHLMYGRRQTNRCPMCTMWIDGYNGVAQHLARNVDFAIAAAADPSMLLQHARNRGWRNLRLLSCGSSKFKYDLRSEDAEGRQDPTISVFTRDRDGTLRHSYSAHPWMANDVKERGIDLLTAVYNVLDLTPQGRSDWYAKLAYDE